MKEKRRNNPGFVTYVITHEAEAGGLHEFQASLGYRLRINLKKKKTTTNKKNASSLPTIQVLTRPNPA